MKDGNGAIGTRVRARVVKNKIAPPFREAEFDIMFDSGISYEGDLLDLALAADIVEKSGAWFNYGKIRLGQGRENAKKYLIDYPEVRNELKDKVMSTKGLASPIDGGGEGTSRTGRGGSLSGRENCGLMIADCGLVSAALIPQSAIRNPKLWQGCC